MASNEELEKRIETQGKELQNLKAFLQFQIRKKKKMIRFYILRINLSEFSFLNLVTLHF